MKIISLYTFLKFLLLSLSMSTPPRSSVPLSLTSPHSSGFLFLLFRISVIYVQFSHACFSPFPSLRYFYFLNFVFQPTFVRYRYSVIEFDSWVLPVFSSGHRFLHLFFVLILRSFCFLLEVVIACFLVQWDFAHGSHCFVSVLGSLICIWQFGWAVASSIPLVLIAYYVGP